MLLGLFRNVGECVGSSKSSVFFGGSDMVAAAILVSSSNLGSKYPVE